MVKFLNNVVSSGIENGIGFVKMHGSGNDFVLIEDSALNTQLGFTNKTSNSNNLREQNIIAICNPKIGIGCDQLITIELPENENTVDLLIRFYNQDGSAAGMCGNGLRCIGGLYNNYNKTNKCNVKIMPAAPIAEPRITSLSTTTQKDQKEHFLTEVAMGKFTTTNTNGEQIIDIGNKHRVFTNNEEIDYTPSSEYNKNYIKVNKNRIYLTTIERGVGETLCCGSGACATGIACLQLGLLPTSQNKTGTIKITTKGTSNNPLTVKVRFDNETKQTGEVFLIGNFDIVFYGKLNSQAF